MVASVQCVMKMVKIFNRQVHQFPEVLGLSGVPAAGDEATVVRDA